MKVKIFGINFIIFALLFCNISFASTEEDLDLRIRNLATELEDVKAKFKTRLSDLIMTYIEVQTLKEQVLPNEVRLNFKELEGFQKINTS